MEHAVERASLYEVENVFNNLPNVHFTIKKKSQKTKTILTVQIILWLLGHPLQ